MSLRLRDLDPKMRSRMEPRPYAKRRIVTAICGRQNAAPTENGALCKQPTYKGGGLRFALGSRSIV